MFNAISTFFSSLWDSISIGLQYIGHFFTSLFGYLKVIPDALRLLYDSLSVLPTPLVIFAELSISVLVVFLILNREEGG